MNLANARMRLYQLDLAERTAYEALKIGEQTGDLVLTTNILACLGSLLIIRGEQDRAMSHYNEVMKNAEVLSDSVTLLDTPGWAPTMPPGWVSIWRRRHMPAGC